MVTRRYFWKCLRNNILKTNTFYATVMPQKTRYLRWKYFCFSQKLDFQTPFKGFPRGKWSKNWARCLGLKLLCMRDFLSCDETLTKTCQFPEDQNDKFSISQWKNHQFHPLYFPMKIFLSSQLRHVIFIISCFQDGARSVNLYIQAERFPPYTLCTNLMGLFWKVFPKEILSLLNLTFSAQKNWMYDGYYKEN